MLAACVPGTPPALHAQTGPATQPDTLAIVAVGRALATDSMRGRGPWTPDATRAARFLAERLEQLGAKPVVGSSLLVPMTTEPHPKDTVYNVVGVLPNAAGSITGDLVGLTAHLDHLGVGEPDARGDSIYNGFLDDALSIGMILDIARRWNAAPGSRGLLIMFFNLEEQGLLGSKVFAERRDVVPVMNRLKLLVGVDAGAPAGEAMEWQLMGGLPEHAGTRIADSLARARGWTTTSTVPRPINDVFVFSQRGVPILFPIPGKTWRGYTPEQRDEAMRRFDHYHQPSDEYNPAFPLIGTWYYADWLYQIIRR
jgi:hypothetical protein